MKIAVRTGPTRPKPSPGDIKTCKDGLFVREHARVKNGWIGAGAYLMSNGRPVYQWKRIGDAPEGFKGRAVIEYKGGR